MLLVVGQMVAEHAPRLAPELSKYVQFSVEVCPQVIETVNKIR